MSDIATSSAAGNIAVDTSRLGTRANLDKAGKQLEAVFDGMMLKAMRQTHLSDPLFESKALDTFTEMQDARVAQSMAEHAPIGIGRAVTAFLSHAKPDLNEKAPDPTP